MSSEIPDEAGKSSTNENEILSSDVEFDSIQIKESSETVSNTATTKVSFFISILIYFH